MLIKNQILVFGIRKKLTFLCNIYYFIWKFYYFVIDTIRTFTVKPPVFLIEILPLYKSAFLSNLPFTFNILSFVKTIPLI